MSLTFVAKKKTDSIPVSCICQGMIQLMMRLQEELNLQEKVVGDWRKEAQILKWDRQKMHKEYSKLEYQMKIDRKNCAAFMGGMLSKNRVLVNLSNVVPQYNILQSEIQKLESENEVMYDTLQNCFSQLNERLPAQSKLITEMGARERLIEDLISEALDTYNKVFENSQRRVEDVLPYLKVVQRPGDYKFYRAPGEPEPSAPVGNTMP